MILPKSVRLTTLVLLSVFSVAPKSHGSAIVAASNSPATPQSNSTTQIISPEEQARVTAIVQTNFSEIMKRFDTYIRCDYDVPDSEERFYPDAITIPQLPGYYIKVSADRIEGAKLITRCIDENKLGHLLTVPEKWLVHLPEKYQHIERYKFFAKNYLNFNPDRHLVIARELKRASPGKQMSPEQLSAVCTVLRRATYANRFYFNDTAARNWIMTDDGRVGFIDTEITKGFRATTPEEGLDTLQMEAHNLIGDRGSQFVTEEIKKVKQEYAHDPSKRYPGSIEDYRKERKQKIAAALLQEAQQRKTKGEKRKTATTQEKITSNNDEPFTKKKKTENE